jgi:L-alanine-DL-glutamate epimerase-like enolase superfamily enzyme
LNSPSPDTVIRAEAIRATVPLETPVRLGAARIAERIYVALRLTLADGSQGYAYGYDRGMPLFEVTCAAAARYLGRAVREREALRHEALGPTPAPRATMVRGVSLCDIALWDAACTAAGMPLHAAIGTQRDRIELMPVIGYGMTPEVAAREGEALADRGFRTLKLMLDGGDLGFDRAVIEALARALPDGVRFGLDAHWSWHSVEAALPWCRIAEDAGALFLEDPVAPTDWRIAAELRGRTRVPLCLGEDAIDLASLRDMAEGADILRIDAAASGGVGFARDGLALAALHGKSVIPHVFATLHQHLAYSHRSVTRIEVILPELGADPIDRFLTAPLTIAEGCALAPDRPGAGLSLDWEALAPFTTRREVLTL